LCEEWQWRFAERLQGPQSTAAIKSNRAERVGFCKTLERAAPQAAAAPQRARVWITASPGSDEPFRIGFGKAFDLTQPEAQGLP
jgi:hypothetical protein